MNKRKIFFVSILLALLVGICSFAGLRIPGFYENETADWQVQSIGQDLVDAVLILPVLVGSAVLFFIGFRWALPVWAGALLYLIYTFVIYCFNIHFNRLFIIYVLVLGISAYRFLYFAGVETKAYSVHNGRSLRVTAAYLFVIAVLFALLWLSDLVPALLSDRLPQNLVTAGLVTNPVHVLDLAFFLPGMAIVGILAWKQKSAAIQLIPVILTFCLLMDLTIAALTLMQLREGTGNVSAAVATVMSALALISLVLLVLNLKGQKSAV